MPNINQNHSDYYKMSFKPLLISDLETVSIAIDCSKLIPRFYSNVIVFKLKTQNVLCTSRSYVM